MIACPICHKTDNITYITRHQLVDRYDTDTAPNVITILHADPECGFNQTYWIEDCLEDIFPMWKDGPRPEPRNRGVLTEDQVRMYGFNIGEEESPAQDDTMFDDEIHEAVPMEMFEAMSGIPEETEVAPADDIIVAEE